PAEVPGLVGVFEPHAAIAVAAASAVVREMTGVRRDRFVRLVRIRVSFGAGPRCRGPFLGTKLRRGWEQLGKHSVYLAVTGGSSSCRDAGSSRSPHAARRGSAPKGVTMRVLLVEDHGELADTIADVLRGEGMAVDVVLDGAAALRNASIYDYDVVVL